MICLVPGTCSLTVSVRPWDTPRVRFLALNTCRHTAGTVHTTSIHEQNISCSSGIHVNLHPDAAFAEQQGPQAKVTPAITITTTAAAHRGDDDAGRCAHHFLLLERVEGAVRGPQLHAAAPLAGALGVGPLALTQVVPALVGLRLLGGTCTDCTCIPCLEFRVRGSGNWGKPSDRTAESRRLSIGTGSGCLMSRSCA